MSRFHTRALVDESYRDRYYVMSGCVVVPASGAYRRLLRELETAAAELPGQSIHCVELTRPTLTQLESTVTRSGAVEAIVAVSAPIEPTDAGRAVARQRCLAELAVAVTRHHGVREMWLDSLDDLDNADGRKAGRQFARRNPHDLQTLRGLQRAGDIPADLRSGWASHHDDRRQHGLWLPDLTAYAVNQALHAGDGARLDRLAPITELLPARRLPLNQRQPGTMMLPDTGLRARLLRLRLAGLAMTPAQLIDDPAAHQELTMDVERRARAVTDRYTHTHHAPLPALQEYTQPGEELGR